LGMYVAERNAFELNPCNKKHNSVFEGLQIGTLTQIVKDEEVLLDYTPRDRKREKLIFWKRGRRQCR